MDTKFKDKFLARWKKYFDGAGLPITFEYTNDERGAELVKPTRGARCFMDSLREVFEGASLRYSAESIQCEGGKHYSGFSEQMRGDIADFLSCGKPGLRGERYKKTPEIAAKALAQVPWHAAPTKYIVFKRWDKLTEADNPEIVIFLATPDVLSGLFTLAGFDVADPRGITSAPFGSGCSQLIQYPYAEKLSGRHRAILGLFDASARPYLSEKALSFTVTIEKLARMVEDMDESFLITPSWKAIKKRIEQK
jgi:hypothetical protein